MGPASAWPIATSQATGSPMSTAMMSRAPTTVSSTAPAIASSRPLGAVPGLADADLAADDGLADDVGEEAGQGDRRDGRADGRQVVADDAVEPEAVAVDGQGLPAGDPGAQGGGRHEADEGGDHREADGRGDVPADRLGHGAVEVTEGQWSQRDDAGPSGPRSAGRRVG